MALELLLEHFHYQRPTLLVDVILVLEVAGIIRTGAY